MIREEEAIEGHSLAIFETYRYTSSTVGVFTYDCNRHQDIPISNPLSTINLRHQSHLYSTIHSNNLKLT